MASDTRRRKRVRFILDINFGSEIKKKAFSDKLSSVRDWGSKVKRIRTTMWANVDEMHIYSYPVADVIIDLPLCLNIATCDLPFIILITLDWKVQSN